jgi:hypothetical protein
MPKGFPNRSRCRSRLLLQSAVAAFGAKAKAKLSNPGASGEPEDQLRVPFEQLLAGLAQLCSLRGRGQAEAAPLTLRY